MEEIESDEETWKSHGCCEKEAIWTYEEISICVTKAIWTFEAILICEATVSTCEAIWTGEVTSICEAISIYVVISIFVEMETSSASDY